MDKTKASNDTRKLLDDIVSWELDLSEYESLEKIISSRYNITLKEDAQPYAKKDVREYFDQKLTSFAKYLRTHYTIEVLPTGTHFFNTSEKKQFTEEEVLKHYARVSSMVTMD